MCNSSDISRVDLLEISNVRTSFSRFVKIFFRNWLTPLMLLYYFMSEPVDCPYERLDFEFNCNVHVLIKTFLNR